jgi:hypothetical protein
MKKNNGVIFVAIFIIIVGLDLLISGDFSVKGNRIDLSKNNLNIYLGLFFLILSIIIVYMSRNSNSIAIDKTKTPQYTKCPNCKEVFNYNELINGKCKNCKDVDTIDLDEYFEKYPEELEKKD